MPPLTVEPPAALLAALLEAPDELSPRLVLADWLEEHGGDSERGDNRPCWLRLNGHWELGVEDARLLLFWYVLFSHNRYRLGPLPEALRPRCADCAKPAWLRWPAPNHDGSQVWLCWECYELTRPPGLR